MVDCHMHMVLDGVWWKDAMARHAKGPEEHFIRQTLSSYHDRGFTWLRDGGDRLGAGKRARELAPEYGITYRTPLSPLCKKGHYGAFIGTVFENRKEFTELVKRQKALGADFIKIMISGLMDFDRYGVLTEEGLSREEIRELVDIPHQMGLSVMVHSNGITALYAAEAGVDSVEHGAYLPEEALYAMKEAGSVWVPTISTVGNLRGKGRFQEEAVQAIFADTSANIRTFAAMGGLLAPGTDAGAWAVPHGTDSEYRHLEAILGTDFEAVLAPGTKRIMEKF